MAFRRICHYFNLPYPVDPKYPHEKISVSREEFDEAIDQLTSEGVPIVSDRDQAWSDFAGWRVNYDSTLLALCALTMAPPGNWSSDRITKTKLPPIILPIE